MNWNREPWLSLINGNTYFWITLMIDYCWARTSQDSQQSRFISQGINVRVSPIFHRSAREFDISYLVYSIAKVSRCPEHYIRLKVPLQRHYWSGHTMGRGSTPPLDHALHFLSRISPWFECSSCHLVTHYPFWNIDVKCRLLFYYYINLLLVSQCIMQQTLIEISWTGGLALFDSPAWVR